MLKLVRITDKLTHQLIAEYPIVLEYVTASNADFYDEAWKNAIDEGLVENEKRSDHEIEFVDYLP